jgi:transposase-like protein
MEKCRELVDATIDEAGRIVVMALLEGSASVLTGAPHQGRKGGEHVRHGSGAGAVYLAGRKVQLERPRVRAKDGTEAKIPAYEMLRSDEKARERVGKAVVSGVSSRRYREAMSESFDAVGVSASSVSRRFVKESSDRLEKLMERPVPEDLVALIIDGINVGPASLITAVGIDSKGTKHVLGIAEGTTENASVAGDLLADLAARGLDFTKPILFVIDGGKALRKAIREVCGVHHPVQRCRIHKLRNVEDRLPEGKKAYVRASMRAAYKLGAERGIPKMKELAAELGVSHPDAGRSLLEGLEETFTVNRLGLPPLLVLSLGTTNIIENANGSIRKCLGRVKRFRSQADAKRWAATALLEAEKTMRTIKGCKEIWMLQAALEEQSQKEAV